MTTVLESLNRALQRSMANDPCVYILGEDVLDPYGGAFKVTRGLSEKYPERVITTPISEAGFIGLAGGMALRGLRPVAEIMFGDFITLAADQLVNHISKFRWMYNEQVQVPLVIRTPMGGRRGYGPTHSQTLEKMFLGVPGLIVVAPNILTDPGEILEYAILEVAGPVLFVENKLQYLQHIIDLSSEKEFVFDELTQNISTTAGTFPTTRMSIAGAPTAGLTIATYGYMVDVVRRAALTLAYDYEIFPEVVVPTLLSPFRLDSVIASTRSTGKLLVVEEAPQTMGWGAEVITRVAEESGDRNIRFKRLAAKDTPVPASRLLEDAVLPSVDDVVKMAREMV